MLMMRMISKKAVVHLTPYLFTIVEPSEYYISKNSDNYLNVRNISSNFNKINKTGCESNKKRPIERGREFLFKKFEKKKGKSWPSNQTRSWGGGKWGETLP